MSVLIQQAAIGDLERLYQIERECFTSEAFSKGELIYLLRSPGSISLTARTNGEIAGFIMGSVQKRGKTETGHIFTLDVAVKRRRKGVGQKLLKRFEQILAERGVETCYLEVRADNVAALELYRKNGYVKVEQLKNYYQRGVHGVRLKKTLSTRGNN